MSDREKTVMKVVGNENIQESRQVRGGVSIRQLLRDEARRLGRDKERLLTPACSQHLHRMCWGKWVGGGETGCL